MAYVFMDIQFTELTKNAQLISIGLVGNDGRTFYAESTEVDFLAAMEQNPYLKDHVLPYLKLFKNGEYGAFHWDEEGKHVSMRDSELEIAKRLKEWFSTYDQVVIVGDVLAWDWVLFCELFGGAIKLSEGIPQAFYIPIDLADEFRSFGYSANTSREQFADVEVHSDLISQTRDALYRAKVIKVCWDKLQQTEYVRSITAQQAEALHGTREALRVAATEDQYMLGLYNGMEMAMAAIENRDTQFLAKDIITRFSAEELVLVKLRAEFDYLWVQFGRDHGVQLALAPPEEPWEGAAYWDAATDEIVVLLQEIWTRHPRGSDMEHKALFDRIHEYAAKLETLILNRLTETSYPRDVFGTDGIASLTEQGTIPQPVGMDIALLPEEQEPGENHEDR